MALVSTEAAGDTDHLVHFALSKLDPSTPAFCLAPGYQAVLERVLDDDPDAQHVTRYTPTIKFLAARVQAPAFVPARA